MRLLRNIPAAPKCCSMCAEVFVDGQPVRSAIIEVDGHWQRLSWCDACWEGMGPSDEFLTSWRSVFSAKPGRRTIPPDALPELLDRVLREPRWKGLAPLLAWHLVRRKSLKFSGNVQREDAGILIFTVSATGDTIEVPDATPDPEMAEAFRELIALTDEIAQA